MKWLKRQIIYWLAKNLLPHIDEKDIISFRKQPNGKYLLYVGGEQVSDQEAKDITR
jgi:hypothetical protein